MTVVMERDALLSPDGVYRYWLMRHWGSHGGRRLVTVMLNPSTADAAKDDATIRRLIGFGKAWGYEGLLVVNLFAFRSTDPKALRTTAFDPVGELNDDVIRTNCRQRDVLCAWGAHGTYQDRDKRVRQLLKDVEARPKCLGLTKDGQPLHPLRLPKSLVPVTYA